MLRIKRKINLKELEKYGFKQSMCKETYYIEKEYGFNVNDKRFEKYTFELIVNPYGVNPYGKEKNKIVGCFTTEPKVEDENGDLIFIDEIFDLDVLYDLIKNGFIEKVEDK